MYAATHLKALGIPLAESPVAASAGLPRIGGAAVLPPMLNEGRGGGLHQTALPAPDPG